MARKNPQAAAAVTTAAAALAISQAQANAYSIVPHTMPQATATALYMLGAKQPRGCNTKQGAKSGLGKAWHTAATVAPNSRLASYAALQALPAPFTQAQALTCLAATMPAGIGATAAGRWAAFVASGYIVPAVGA